MFHILLYYKLQGTFVSQKKTCTGDEYALITHLIKKNTENAQGYRSECEVSTKRRSENNNMCDYNTMKY